jgi:predicted ATP-grasp superfamily ATP-dependent carboligase
MASARDAVLVADAMSMPVVLKPTRSVRSAGGAKHGVVHARDREALMEVAARLPSDAYPVLAQERITGPGLGVFLLRWGGALVAAFAHRRVREYPPSGGGSVLCESMALDPLLLTQAEALLQHFDWSGVAMVELKQDATTGESVLMEVNARFWGSLQLAVDAGVDFPRLLLECATGGAPRPVTTYAVGMRSRWWWGDVDHLLARMRRSARDLDLPPVAPGRIRVLGDFIATTLTGRRDQVIRLDDPGPALRETFDWFRDLL